MDEKLDKVTTKKLNNLVDETLNFIESHLGCIENKYLDKNLILNTLVGSMVKLIVTKIPESDWDLLSIKISTHLNLNFDLNRISNAKENKEQNGN